MVNRYPLSSLGSDFVSLREAMDRLLNDSFVGGPLKGIWASTGGNGGRMGLPLDVYATTDEVVIIAAAPGLGPDDLQITVNQNTVTLSGQLPNVAASEEAKDATWYLHELVHGTFQRSVTLPIEVDASKADATFEQGVLRLTLPKAEQARPRQIQVRTGGGSTAASNGTAARAQGATDVPVEATGSGS